MVHTVYKITNILNGMIYVGKHSTDNPDDGYMGSGKYLSRAIAKHGLENFRKEVLYIFGTEDEALQKEAEIVNEDFVKRLDTYNVNTGGNGSFFHLTNNKEFLRLRNLKQWSDPEFRDKSLKRLNWTGRKHTDDSKRKIGKANSIYQSGERNSQFGTCWIHNSVIEKCIKIKLDELDEFLRIGWIRGRKMKF